MQVIFYAKYILNCYENLNNFKRVLKYDLEKRMIL